VEVAEVPAAVDQVVAEVAEVPAAGDLQEAAGRAVEVAEPLSTSLPQPPLLRELQQQIL
jgi:hypothetical protein